MDVPGEFDFRGKNLQFDGLATLGLKFGMGSGIGGESSDVVIYRLAVAIPLDAAEVLPAFLLRLCIRRP